MKDENQILALAGFVGIRNPQYGYRCQRRSKGSDECFQPVVCSHDKNLAEQFHRYLSQDWEVTPLERYERWDMYPKYLEDLNAIHRIEKALKEEEMDEYIYTLKTASLDDCGRYDAAILSTAEKRAKYILKTIGLWEK